MKRLPVILLSLSLLLACVPTPEQEFVVNKGDDIVEQQLNATPDPDNGSIAARQTFPDRWDEDPIAENEHLVVRAAACVRTKPDGLYPVYRTRSVAVTKDMAINVAVKFLDKPTASSESLMTKDDWGQALQEFLDIRSRYDAWVQAGKPNDWPDVDEYEWTPEEIENETNWYMEQIKNAPDSLSEQAVYDYSDLKSGQPTSFKLASGEIASIVYGKEGFTIAKGCKHLPNVYDVYQYRDDLEWKEGKYKFWMESDLTREQAEAVGLAETEKLGFSGFVIAGACEATLFDIKEASTRAVTGGWYLTLKRGFDGYPQLTSIVGASQNLQYGSDDAFAVNAYIPQERLHMFVSENGLQMIDYSSPKDISGLVNANVRLLPFDEVKHRIANTLLMCFPYESYGKMTAERNENSPRLEVEIYDIMLTTYTLHIKDDTDFYEMPCWVISYDCCDPVRGADDWEYRKSLRELELYDANCSHDALVINAVDGSVVHTDYGY